MEPIQLLHVNPPELASPLAAGVNPSQGRRLHMSQKGGPCQRDHFVAVADPLCQATSSPGGAAGSLSIISCLLIFR